MIVGAGKSKIFRTASWLKTQEELIADVLAAQSSLTLWDPMDDSPPGSAHGILQARILEWVAILFSSGCSWLRNQTQVSCIAGRFFTIWTTTEALIVDGTVQIQRKKSSFLTWGNLSCFLQSFFDWLDESHPHLWMAICFTQCLLIYMLISFLKITFMEIFRISLWPNIWVSWPILIDT